MKKMLLATGQPKIDEVISKKVAGELGYEVIGKVDYKKDLFNITYETKPDVVIVSKSLTGKEMTVLEAMLKIRTELSDVRIIYLAGAYDENNKQKVDELATLVLAGVFDILHEKAITLSLLKEIIMHPRDREQVQYLVKHIKTNVMYEDEVVDITEEEEVEDVEEDGYKNVYLVSSIKPGTGKTFVSCNLATCLAKYGVKKSNGKKPKVAIIEADLQNLSVGTILQIESEEKNLKTVMQKIASIMDKDGNLIDDVVKIEEVNTFIKSAFQKYEQVNNLFALVGSQLTMDEVENIKPLYYVYLIEQIIDEYDIVIIDTNSSLAHVTTYPLLRMAHTAFYFIDLDFNNVRNNSRYKKTLEDIEVFDKIKYVLNKDITKENRALTNRTMIEDLMFDAEALGDLGFNIIARLPELPPEVFLNRLFTGTPVVLDDNNYTLKTRIEVSKIANEIWEIENLDWLNKEYERYKEKTFNTTKKKGLFGR